MLWPMIKPAAMAATLLGVGGCGPPATEARFDSANPAAKMYAIEEAARTLDTSSTAGIVEQLDSDDPAVRMLAIEALQLLTGETYGYRHYDPVYLRRAAIKRWVEAVESGTLPVASNAGTSRKSNG